MQYDPPFFCTVFSSFRVFKKITPPRISGILLPGGRLAEGGGLKKTKCFPASGDAFWNRGSKLNMWPCFVKKMEHHKILLEIGPDWRGGWVEKIMITTFCRGVLLARNRVTPRNSTRHPHFFYCKAQKSVAALPPSVAGRCPLHDFFVFFT